MFLRIVHDHSQVIHLLHSLNFSRRHFGHRFTPWLDLCRLDGYIFLQILQQVELFYSGKDREVHPKLDGLISVKHDLRSAGLNITIAAQMFFERYSGKAFVNGLPMLESEQGS